MKTNTLQITIAVIVGSTLALAAASTIAITVSYLAVAILFAVAAVDYRQGPKAYSAR
jgi:hypothetical protein